MKSILGRVSLRMEKVLMLTRYLNIPIKNMSSVQNYTYTASTFLKPAIERYRKFIRDGFNSTFTEPRCSRLVWGRIESFFSSGQWPRTWPSPVQPRLWSLSGWRTNVRNILSKKFLLFLLEANRFWAHFETCDDRISRWWCLKDAAAGCRLVAIGDNWTAVYLRDHLIVLISWLFFYLHRKWNVLLLLFSIQEWRTLARTTQSGYF